ncbi:hypothetical protein ACFPM0_32035 [Pseudonocardia sulfidoxydans]
MSDRPRRRRYPTGCRRRRRVRVSGVREVRSVTRDRRECAVRSIDS